MINLTIISITKDDFEGISKTIDSTFHFRTNSILKQIIIDSSDHQTAKRLQQHIQGQPNITYHWANASGISNAFNLGIKYSTTDWVWFLNGGDTIINDPQNTFTLRAILSSSADLVITQTTYERSKTTRDFPPMWLLWPSISAWIPHPSVLIKRDCFLKFGMFDPKYKAVMDYDYWLLILNKNIKTDILSVPLVIFNEDGMSSSNQKLVARECLSSIKRRLPSILKQTLIRNILIFKDITNIIKRAYF